MKMNSIDRAYRDRKDIAELLEIADMATKGFCYCSELDDPDEEENQHEAANCLRDKFKSLRDRRAREDAGEQLP